MKSNQSKLAQWLPFGGFLVVTLIGGILITACTTVDQTVMMLPTIEGATFVGNQSCMECHASIAQTFDSSPHGQFHHVTKDWEGESGCESCHGPGSKHVAAGGGKGVHILNPTNDPSTCFKCHPGIHAKFELPHSHPVIEGRMGCASCHDPHGPDIMNPSGGGGFARLNQACAQCHREQTKPVIFEHEAMREGCVVCHNPHGSFNDKLLVERDANLCLKCHAQVQGSGVVGGELFIGKQEHSLFLSQGTCWTAGCHQGIHGSNIHPRFRYR
jgi:predicted CXXCH cytochrome family protein